VVVRDSNDWVARLETPGTSFLAPFTSETTRKDGRQLVLLSALTILLSRGIITIGEGSFAGLKAQPSRIADVVLLAGLACAYFLLLYAFDLYRDWRATEYKRLPAAVEYNRLRNEAIQQQNAKTERWDFLASETSRLLQLRRDKSEELSRLDRESQPAGVTEASSAEFEVWIEKDRERQQDRLKRMDEFAEYCRDDGLDGLSAEYTALSLDRTLLARFEALLTMRKRTYLVDRLRLAIEVLFPVGLSAFAVILAARQLFH
jgi:hypothetical protein